MNILDDPETLFRLDPDDMRGRLRDFPQQIRDAWANVSGWDVDPEQARGIHELLVLGMGGSAIGADLVAGLLADRLAVPMLVHRGYDLPGWVDGDTLVVASSYSGGTEETLSGWRAAGEAGARRIAVTTGGALADEARAAAVPLLSFRYDSQPRAALGHSFTLTLGLLWKLGLIADPSASVQAAATLLDEAQRDWQPDVPLEDNWPKQLASWWHVGVPVTFGAEHLAAVARRWSTQINENSKSWAIWADLPELNHNIVVGFEQPALLRYGARVVCLRSDHYHSRNSARFDITTRLLENASVSWGVIEAVGDDRLSELLWATLFADYASYYLALLTNSDPTPVQPIQQLKQRLAEVE